MSPLLLDIKMGMRYIKRLVLGFTLLALLLFGMLAFVEISFSRMNPPPFYSAPNKVWGHRGLTDSFSENTIGSFAAAYDAGAKGVELDIFYIDDQDYFLVTHGLSANANQKSKLLLEHVFDAFGQRGYYWLDFKNLKSLDPLSTQHALKHLQLLAETYSVKNKVIVESDSPRKLAFFSRKGYATSFWAFPNSQSSALRFWAQIVKIKWKCYWYDISVISMNHLLYDEKVASAFSHFPIHLYTVNEQERMEELIERDAVKVILSDKDFFYLSSQKD